MAEREGWPSFAATLVSQTAGRTAGAAAIGALLFVAGAVALHRAWLGAGSRLGWQVLVAVLLLPLFAVAGAAAGAALAVTSALRRALTSLEAGLHALLQPVMTRLIESTRLGRTGIGIERFERLLDAEIAGLGTGAAPDGRWSPARLLVRVVGGGALRLTRRLLVREFLDRLRREGRTEVTPAAVEAFAREKLMALLADRLRAQLNAAHWTIWAASLVMVAGPFVYLLTRR